MLLARNQGHALKTACADAEHDRQRGDQQRPLVHLARHKRPDSRGRSATPYEKHRHNELRRLRCKWRKPLHEQELVNVQLGAGLDQAVGEWLRGQEDRERREREQPKRDEAPRWWEKLANQRRWSDQVWLFGRSAAR